MSFMSYFIEVRYRRQLYRIRVSRASSILALGLIQPRASNNCNALVIMPNSCIFCARMHLIASRKQKPWAAGNLSQTTLSELSRPRSRLGRGKSQTRRRPRLSIITLIVDKPEPPQYFRQVIAYEARQPNVNIYERSLFGCMLCCMWQCALEPALDYDALVMPVTGPYSAIFECMKTAFMLMATWSLLTWRMAPTIYLFSQVFRR